MNKYMKVESEMKNITILLLANVLSAHAVSAAQFGTADEARKLLDRAIAHVEAVGPDAAFKDFSDTKGKFVDRDLYVFCNDGKGIITANGGNPALVNRDLHQIADVDGYQFMKEMEDQVKAKGSGEVRYKWLNPVSKIIQEKVSFVKATSAGAFCGVGVYALSQ